MSEHNLSAQLLMRDSQRAARAMECLLEARTGSRAEVGDLFVLPEAGESPLEWAVVKRHPLFSSLLLVVPADTNPLRGRNDLEVPRTSASGPLSLRCGFAIWMEDTLLRWELRTGLLEERALKRTRHKCEGGESEGVGESEAGGDGDGEQDRELSDWIRDYVTPVFEALVPLRSRVQQRPDISRGFGSVSSDDGNACSPVPGNSKCVANVSIDNARSRVESPYLWAELRELSDCQRKTLVQTAHRFRCWGLCELLCEESRQTVTRDATEALRLAGLAMLVLEHLDRKARNRFGDTHDRSDHDLTIQDADMVAAALAQMEYLAMYRDSEPGLSELAEYVYTCFMSAERALAAAAELPDADTRTGAA